MNEKQATIKLAELSEQIGNIKQAIQYYEDVLPCDNDRVYGNLARLYSQLYGFEKKEQCIKYAMRAYELNPNNKINLDNLAMVFNKYGMLLQACPLYEMSLKIEELVLNIIKNLNISKFPFSKFIKSKSLRTKLILFPNLYLIITSLLLFSI